MTSKLDRQDRIVFHKMFRYLCMLLWEVLKCVNSSEIPMHVSKSWELLEPQFAEWRDQ